MRKYLYAAVSVCLIYQHSEAKIGFSLPISPDVPTAVQTSARSVLKIQAPIMIFDLRNKEQAEKQQKMLSGLDQIIPNKTEREQVRVQLESCKTADQYCIIWSTGSAVALENGSLLTALHVVEYYFTRTLPSNSKWSDALSKEFPIRLWDSKGRLLTGSGDKGQTNGQIIKLHSTQMNRDISEPHSDLTDFAIISLNKNLGLPGVKVRSESLSYDGTNYVVGFPVATFDRSQLGGLDSDGKSQFISFGPKEVDFKKIQPKSQYTADVISRILQNKIYFSGDCVSGFSGGAILDSNGSLLGVFTGNNIPGIDVHYDPTNICGGIRTEGFR